MITMKAKALVVIDIQREYATPGRLFHIAGIDQSLHNANMLLQHAREQGWPVVHVQHLQDGDLFGRDSSHSGFIDGFEPKGKEILATKGNYSSFSSQAFERFMIDHSDHEFVVIGYGTTMCCLSTIVEGYHRGYSFALVEDACAARAARGNSEASMHQHAVAILEPFARITATGAEVTAA
jgi:ureidoacrylate peracid hydrolase